MGEKMKPINIGSTKRCAFCKHWFDPGDTAIRPRNVKHGLWEYDPDTKRVCEKRRYERPGNAFCNEYECKIP